MIFKFLRNIPAIMGQSEFINSTYCMCAICKYFICPLFILVPCFVVLSFSETGDIAAEYSRCFLMRSEDIFEFPDSITVENINVIPRVKMFTEFGGRLPVRNESLDRKCPKNSDKCNSKPDSTSWADYIQIAFLSLISVIIPMYPVFRNSRKHNGELRGQAFEPQKFQ